VKVVSNVRKCWEVRFSRFKRHWINNNYWVNIPFMMLIKVITNNWKTHLLDNHLLSNHLDWLFRSLTSLFPIITIKLNLGNIRKPRQSLIKTNSLIWTRKWNRLEMICKTHFIIIAVNRKTNRNRLMKETKKYSKQNNRLNWIKE